MKLMIFGRPGSGKSTYAFKLSKKLFLPLYHLDKYFYQANWTERNYQEFLKIQQNIVNTNSWIIDGNCTSSLEMRYSQANLVVYFNYSHLICYWRVLKRFIRKNKEIEDRANGCKENIRISLIKYMWGFNKRVASPINLLKSKYPDIKFIEINNYQDLQQLERNLNFFY